MSFFVWLTSQHSPGSLPFLPPVCKSLWNERLENRGFTHKSRQLHRQREWETWGPEDLVFVLRHLEPSVCFFFFFEVCLCVLHRIKLTPKTASTAWELLYSWHDYNPGDQYKSPKAPDRSYWVKRGSCKCIWNLSSFKCSKQTVFWNFAGQNKICPHVRPLN